MKVILLLAFVIVAVTAFSQDKKAFALFKKTHNKNYASHRDHAERYHIFRENLKFIRSHDAVAKGFTVEVNEFADLTHEEFLSWACRMNKTANIHLPQIRLAEDLSGLPASMDWRQKGAVTPVKNQGQCGSCWSFSTTGSVEGAHFLKTGNLVSLSEQNLIDCSVAEGNQGCNGGLMDDAFQYIIKNNGIVTEASYPYTATGPNTCNFQRANVAATISSYQDVAQGDENSLLQAAALRPVSVAIDASHQSFQFYSGGVYYEPSCSATQLDHGVLVAGYGTEGTKDFWLVKNSWGGSWGLSGYLKMSRNRGNNCGIATAASYPIIN